MEHDVRKEALPKRALRLQQLIRLDPQNLQPLVRKEALPKRALRPTAIGAGQAEAQYGQKRSTAQTGIKTLTEWQLSNGSGESQKRSTAQTGIKTQHYRGSM